MPIFATFSPGDLTVVFVVALLIFGPKKLPELGRQAGTALRELRKLSGEFTGTLAGMRDEMTGLGDEARRSPAADVPTEPRDQPPAPSPAQRGRRGLSLTTVPPESADPEGQEK